MSVALPAAADCRLGARLAAQRAGQTRLAIRVEGPPRRPGGPPPPPGPRRPPPPQVPKACSTALAASNLAGTLALEVLRGIGERSQYPGIVVDTSFYTGSTQV